MTDIAAMPEARVNRRLAAILAADVVGYSRLMAADEAGTLGALKHHRQTVFDPAVANHGGRIVKLIGDGTLVEFMSVVEAVACAVAIQHAIHDQADGDGSPRIILRIGINLGDVIADDDDIYGDGVNIAARLEPLAEPGGICVSSIVNESVRGRIDAAFEDAGEVMVKNIDRPIKVWKWRPSTVAASPTAAKPVEPETKPTVAVLPFDNMSGDPEQEYFSDGITEDIITDLSKVGGLIVIARNSSFAYKGQSVDLRKVGLELGVGVILEGSVRRAGNRVRITAQLIDAANGGHLWAERYDRDLTDIFAVQDEVTRQIVDALKVALTPGEAAMISGAGTKSVKAHDYFLRARDLSTAVITLATFKQARDLLDRAIELDPNYAEAYAGLSLLNMFDYHNRFTDDPDASLMRADELATKAISLDPKEPLAYHASSVAAGFLGDNERGKQAIDTALELNPNYAPSLSARGVYAIYAGRPGGRSPGPRARHAA